MIKEDTRQVESIYKTDYLLDFSSSPSFSPKAKIQLTDSLQKIEKEKDTKSSNFDDQCGG